MVKVKQTSLWVVAMMLLASGCASTGVNNGDSKSAQAEPVASVAYSIEEGQAQYKLGKYYLGQNRIGLALAAFNRAIAHDPANFDARNARGITLVRIGDFKSAITELETAVASNPDTPYLLNNLAYAHMLNGTLILAAESLQQALRLDPSNTKARENWDQLARKARGNPELQKQLAGYAPPLPTPADSEKVNIPIAPGPRSALRTVPNSVAVFNVNFDNGVTVSEPMVASATLPAMAVDIYAKTLRSTVPNKMAAVVGSTIGPVAAAEPISEDPSKTTIVSSFVPAETLALRGDMIAMKTSSLPKLNPVVAIAKQSPAQFSLGGTRVEIANGNGITSMASVVRTELMRQNVNVWRISNARTFNVPVTQIYFEDGHLNAALAISRMLPVKAEIIMSSNHRKENEIRVVIGKDLNPNQLAGDKTPVVTERNSV